MASCGNLKLNFMKNIDIDEWLLNNNIDPLTEVVTDGKQWFLSDILEKHLKEQFVIHNVVVLKGTLRCKEGTAEEREQQALFINGVGSTFAMEFAQYIAENHYRLVNVLDGWYHWQDEYGIKTTQELLKDFKESIR